MADSRLITAANAVRARKLKTVTFTLDDLLAGLVTRPTLEAEIERLIGILDAADPDPDLEEAGDLEPSLGACQPGTPYDGELDKSDDEPSLGSFDRMANQENWSRTSDAAAFAEVDTELDDCDREDGGDTEENGDEQDLNGDEYDGTMAEDDWVWDGNRPAVPMSEPERRSLIGVSEQLEAISSRKALGQEQRI